MKIPLSVKNFFIIMFSITLIISAIWAANVVFLNNLYLVEKEENLKKEAKRFAKVYTGDFHTHVDEIQKMEKAHGINIIIADELGIIQYTTVIQGNPWGGDAQRWKNDYIKLYDSVTKGLDKNEIVTHEIKDENHDTEMMRIYAPLKNDHILVMEAYIDPVKEVVNFANSLLIYILLGAVLVSIFVSLLISRQITKPISKLSIIAGKMANLDFSIEYEENGKNELNELGTSLNKLSNKLSKTIEELNNANDKLRDDIKKEKKIEKQRKEFVFNISHQLKNPLSIIMNYATKLNNKKVDKADMNYYHSVIEDESTKVIMLTNDLLQISKIESEGNIIYNEKFDIVSMIKSINRKYKTRFDDNDIVYESIFEKDEITIAGDPYRIEQVILSFLNNAIAYVDNKKVIKTSVKEKKESVVVSIYNTGMKIPKEEMPKIWGSFYRIKDKEKKDVKGTGLGLYIVKKILDMHFAIYGVRNIKDGVEFWFEIDKG